MAWQGGREGRCLLAGEGQGSRVKGGRWWQGWPMVGAPMVADGGKGGEVSSVADASNHKGPSLYLELSSPNRLTYVPTLARHLPGGRWSADSKQANEVRNNGYPLHLWHQLLGLPP
jgi:hypothetical protein